MSLRVVVIQHVLELSERSNTGRHVASAWPDTSVRHFGVPHEALQLDDLAGAWLLWPGEGAAPPGRPSSLVVVDASFSQARRMVQKLPQLRTLPRLSLAPPPGRRSLRAAPEGGLSSLEAVAEAIALLEGDVAARPLREAHEALVQRQLAQRGYVGPMR